MKHYKQLKFKHLSCITYAFNLNINILTYQNITNTNINKANTNRNNINTHTQHFIDLRETHSSKFTFKIK